MHSGRRIFAVALLATMLVATACGSSSKSSSSSGSTTTVAGAADPLGPMNPEKGTPVKVGVISDGKGSGIDNSQESPVAQATAKYVNERMGGFAGHPIELVICENNQDPAKAVDCANQLITAKVAAVVIGASALVESAWTPLHKAGIPVMMFGS